MKKLILSLAVISALTFSASAQENRSTEKSEMKDHKRGDEMKDLNLTTEQKTKLKASRADFKTKMDAIDANTSLSEEQKRTQKEALKKEQRAAMQTILTPEQKAKMAEAKDKKEGREDKIKLKEELGLSKEQADKLKALHQSTKAQIDAVNANTNLSETEKKAQIKAIKDKSKAERNAFLTPEQQQKMQEIKKNKKGGGRKGNKPTTK